MNRTVTKVLISGGLGLAMLGGAATVASADNGQGGRPQTQADGQAAKAARFGNLTNAQRSCLTDAGLTRPTGRPTVEQRQALVKAAADCGITIPSGPPAGVGRG